MPDTQASAPEVLSLFRLDGRVAFLSGATGHLGKSMARAWPGLVRMSYSMPAVEMLLTLSPPN